MASVTLVFPHQLYQSHPAVEHGRDVMLIEEWLFFRQYAFHKQKIMFHRASMKFYSDYLEGQGYKVRYIDSSQDISDIRKLLPFIKEEGIDAVHYADTTDNWLEKRLAAGCAAEGLEKYTYESPNFLNTLEEANAFFDTKNSYFQTDFYINQRKRRNILLDQLQKPIGGKWSFDHENRLKIPKGEVVSQLSMPADNKYTREAMEYTGKFFAGNPGQAGAPFAQAGFYPVTFEDANAWLDDFFEGRFYKFGIYQDAMMEHQHTLYHGVLTPMLNTGLLDPAHIIRKASDAAVEGKVNMNTAEGFIRQVLGWREFVRIVYEREGSRQRTTNHWGFSRSIPAAFYTGTTGIVPVDAVIRGMLRSGYSHHIERLMVLGNFFLLCEFDPDEVYRWFMEMYVDAYDWVMVPNVYGMSQFADGGLMSTKPYISGSNYLFKMGDWKKMKPVGEILPWHDTWDALFWRFMHVHRDLMARNPRLAMLLKTFDKMPAEKRDHYIRTAERYLEKLDK
jgi:deoxyribodipyrimidine photolyase-related protein